MTGGIAKGESMIRRQGTVEAAEDAVLPVDLRQWFDTQALVGLVLQSQASMDTGKIRAHIPGRTFPSGQANALLAVLTYCYARNMLSTEDIAQNAEIDPMIRYLCSNRLPSVSTVRRFRRNNRELIQECLAKMFQLAWQKRLERVFLTSSRLNVLHSSQCAVDSNEYRIESGLVSYFEAQAESRLMSAILCDSMEMDA